MFHKMIEEKVREYLYLPFLPSFPNEKIDFPTL